MGYITSWPDIGRKKFLILLAIIIGVTVVGLVLGLWVLNNNESSEATPLPTSTPLSTSPTEPTSPSTSPSSSTPQAKALNIHLVAHSHDDVGWLKTVDQYYNGTNTTIQSACIKCIINSVIESLQKDKNRKFIYVETAFLWKWWNDQSEDKKQIMRDLINGGRLEIIGGGWSMNDEAVTHYQSIIDQFTWGFRRLEDMFGEVARPKVGWQIDPFGHSREQASIFAQMGFDGLFFARLDHQDKEKRLSDKTTEFIWKGSPSLGESAVLFTSVLYNHYTAPQGFCFDTLCPNADHIYDDVEDVKYNLDKKANELVEFALKQAKSYRTNNIMLTMGSDFNYEHADKWYDNLDKLIKYINEKEGSEFKVFYSTPSMYLKAVNSENLTWTTESDDFFPYSSTSHSFWTGYYSSRPTLKYFERFGNNFLQVVKQLLVLSGESDNEKLGVFREQMGVMQHHDAVTGTEKQHVADDYAKFVFESMRDGEFIASKALSKWVARKHSNKSQEFHTCLLLNISSCEHSSKNEKFVVTVYNPTSQPLTTYVRLPIQNLSYNVMDFNGSEVVTQTIPIPQQVTNIPGRTSSSTYELIFRANKIPPLGYQSFFVEKKTIPNGQSTAVQSIGDDEKSISGKSYKVSVENNGKVVVKSLINGQLKIEQSFHYYESRASGAYIFKPNENSTKDIPTTKNFTLFKGPLVEEIHQIVNPWVSQVIRVYKDTDHVEFDWLVGPIPVDGKVGKEIVTKYSSNLKNNGEFFTDSNGREMLKRKLNYRSTWNLKLDEPISGNYYPVATKITIKDESENLGMSILTDRSQGGSSLNDGQIELMLHRRLLKDDGLGVGEVLNEMAHEEGLVARGKHYLVEGNLNETILREKELATEMALGPWYFISPVQESFKEWNDTYKMEGSGLAQDVPPNVRILTLEPWKDGAVLLRLEHLFEVSESSKYATLIEVDIKKLFSDFTMESVEEMTLGANQLSKNMQRLNWHSESNEPKINVNSEVNLREISADSTLVELKPMQIRTFIVRFKNTESKDQIRIVKDSELRKLLTNHLF